MVTREEAFPDGELPNTCGGGTRPSIDSAEMEESVVDEQTAEDAISNETAERAVQYLKELQQIHGLDYMQLLVSICKESNWSDAYLEKTFACMFVSLKLL